MLFALLLAVAVHGCAAACDLQATLAGDVHTAAKGWLRLVGVNVYFSGPAQNCLSKTLPGSSLVTTQLKVEGAQLSVQSNFLCHTRCAFAKELTLTTGAAGKSSCSDFSTRHEPPVCINAYIPFGLPTYFVDKDELKATTIWHGVVHLCQTPSTHRHGVMERTGPQQFDRLAAGNLYVRVAHSYPHPTTPLQTGPSRPLTSAHLLPHTSAHLPPPKPHLPPHPPPHALGTK